jgi:hypothetical protein
VAGTIQAALGGNRIENRRRNKRQAQSNLNRSPISIREVQIQL